MMKEKHEVGKSRWKYIVGMVMGVIFAIPTGFIVSIQIYVWLCNGYYVMTPGYDSPLWWVTFYISVLLFLFSIYQYKQSEKNMKNK
ncbi:MULTISPECIES: hypothetical protein [unclassified Breznakia]|uniref:hypothetical protein n=1 Tax=unclassified Breznakia TaxID=2623764 RepID=UPI0024057618|nr:MULTISPECIES: hypothetical protein [unclassified Breznakia]MDF9837058.1 hypothetical protein [Breznakia sp. PFB2-8]MDF9858983.1 hypothetical protein [Breznakia sp. PH5-24]